MQSKRILVLGCCGSGKSTFARRLGDLTGLPVVHLDRLFWKPGWIQTPRDEFRAVLENALSQDEWIIDGNYRGSLPLRLSYCDSAVYFDFPRFRCLWGVLTRVMKSRGRVRPDMGEGCPERFDWEFIKYTWRFKKDQGTDMERLLRDSGKPVITFRSRRDAKNYLKQYNSAI